MTTTIVNADFPFRQERYRVARLVIRDFLLRALAFRVLAKVEVKGLENVPASGPVLVYINHIHAIDPVVLVGAVTPRFAVPMSKIENFSLPLFGQLMRFWGAYPVRRGHVDTRAMLNTINLLTEGHMVMIAPEGTRQPTLIKAKDGMAYAATRTGAYLIPAAIEGTREFGSHLKRLQRTPISLTFGQPFRFRREGHVPRAELSKMTQEAMYQLSALLPEHRRGYYGDLSKTTTNTLEFM